jgi:uncharacterized protein (TIGR00288 family)
MNGRNQRMSTPRAQHALVHRGPQAQSGAIGAPLHAPNAALLIDFDNVTLGIQKDLGKELRSLLSSEIIKGKVAVQRAYADWRRYPQYIVSLTESSIDLIFAPAYGSSKKNATDIRLAIDALELVFTRPEIGTFILLSGDSDFSSLVIKLKEYGKYVIGVGIRESASDLLVQNCDEYYSYNALAGLMRASDEEETARKYDPWELVTEAVRRMKDNGDVMRSDRLKQVMQEIDSSFDEKNLGISKFSRFCQEAASKGLLSISKLENGQLEVDVPGVVTAAPTRATVADEPEAEREGAERVRRGRRGRGRGRDREGREPRRDREAPEPRAEGAEPEEEGQTPEQGEVPAAPAREDGGRRQAPREVPRELAVSAEPRDAGGGEAIGVSGEKLPRNDAFDLVRRAVDSLVEGEESVRATEVRRRARQLLGRDSQSLSERMFVLVLKDAHDRGVIDLRRRGDDFEVARAADAAPVTEQLARAEAIATPAAPAPVAGAPRIGMGPRGIGGRVRRGPAEPPPDLLMIGVVDEPVVPATPAPDGSEDAQAEDAEAPAAPAAKRGRGRGRKTAKKASKTAKKAAPAASARPAPAPAAPEPERTAAHTSPDAAPARPAAKKRGAKRPRRTAKKAAAAETE